MENEKRERENEGKKITIETRSINSPNAGNQKSWLDAELSFVFVYED